MSQSLKGLRKILLTLALALGIGLQNFPEGMAVVLPLRQSGATQRHCLRWGFWASLAEPVSALLGVALASALNTLGGVVMPVLLSIAAGAMIFIVVEELIPEAHLGEHSNLGTMSVMVGFVVMMILDVALG